MVDQPTTRTMTAEEFLDLPESDELLQLIDGVLIMTPAPALSHQNIVMRILRILMNIPHIDIDDIFPAPTDVHFDSGNVYEPDVAWLSPQNVHCMRVGDKHLRGAPDLIVEVLSPGTGQHDRGKKFRTYETHGVREYWLVNGMERYIEVFVLQGEKFVQFGLFNEQEQFASPVLDNASIDVKQIFPAP